MNDDNKMLIFCFLIYWVTLFLLARKSKNRKKVLLWNISIHLVYSTYFLSALLYKSQGGTALVWWFYLVLIIAIHWMINLGSLFNFKLR